jgi:hypothetical protein
MYVIGDLWQSRRRHDAFSTDGGETFYLLDERWHWPRWRKVAKRLRMPVTPYRTRRAAVA